MAVSIAELEVRLADLRTQLREALRARDQAAAARIRRQLRDTDDAWNAAVEAEAGTTDASGAPPARAAADAPLPRPPAGVPVREQVHQALVILGAPASPKLISTTYQAFFTDPLVTTKLASLRRDEERSFTSQGHSRPYYICAALTYDRLAYARGLLAVSTWPLEWRIIAPLSPRVDFLKHAVGTAEQIQRLTAAGHAPSDAALRLLRRFAFNIPGAHSSGEPEPARVIAAAHDEAAVHRDEDDTQRRKAAARARRLPEVQRLFGSSLRAVAGTSDGSP